MNTKKVPHYLAANKTDQIEYPMATIAVCMLLIYLSPFVSLALNYLAFAICIYRIIRYDVSVFAIDYCVLAGVSYIFLTTGRVSLLAWLSIAAGLWYMIKNGIKATVSLVLLILLMDYMLVRMQGQVNTFVLCFSQLLLLFVLISEQRKEGIVQSAKAFCLSVLFSSGYALLFRNAVQIRSLLGNEAAAYWGSSLTRFQGLLRDPNYYMTMVAISIALLVMLFINHHISWIPLLAGTGLLVLFGALSYSKTFVIVLALFALLCVAMLFLKKKFLLGVGSLAVFALAAIFLSRTLFSVTLYRITSTDSLYDLTTGRSKLLVAYFDDITQSVSSLFFGHGLSAEILERGTHNLFLEIVYYFGLVGLFLMIAYVILLLRVLSQQDRDLIHSNGVFRYTVLIVFIALFCTLQGMTFSITYIMLYLAILATEIAPNTKLSRQEKSFED